MLTRYIIIWTTFQNAMYGKHFSSMYTGSMVGKGALTFAVMGYVVANAIPDSHVGAQVELNPVLLSAILGEPISDIEKTIEFLCSPDLKSRSKEEEGRRLIRIGEYDYRVVNHKKYRAIKNEEDRRKANAMYQKVSRARKRGITLPGEQEYIAALKAGDEILAQQILDRYLPKKEKG